MKKVTDIISQKYPTVIDANDIKGLSRQLGVMCSSLKDRGRSLIVILEGLDASGKSGCAERLTEFISPDICRTVHVSAPDEEEKKYNYLWRFWREIPPVGGVTVFDRSWYGRVLVERIDSFCTEDEWHRAYGEINAFEKFLTDSGVYIVKLWLEVSEDIQLKRFLARAEDPKKRHKITEDDWKNRAKRRFYEKAVSDMFRETDTSYARWCVIPANDKKAARVRALRKVICALSE